MRVVSLGDLGLDVVVRIRGDVAWGADTPAEVSLAAGGQGANVAAWAAALSAEARWLGKRAADGAGRLAADELERRGVELAGPVDPEPGLQPGPRSGARQSAQRHRSPQRAGVPVRSSPAKTPQESSGTPVPR